MNPIKLFSKTKLFFALPNYGRLIVRLYRDARVSAWLKVAGLGTALLLVSPVDPLADIPVLNLFDDAALLLLAAKCFVSLAPASVVVEHRFALGLDRATSMMKNVTPRA